MKMKYIRNIISILTIVALSTLVKAQVPVPSNPQADPIMLVGGTAHIGDGTVIDNAVIGFSEGKLTVVENASSNVDRNGYTVVDISGQHVYPGFILPNSQVGLQEVSAVRAMSDNNEEGNINPNVRALIAYNTDSEIPATLRFNGILLAEATPTGGIVSGTSSVMEMEGWNWEDAAHTVDVAIHLNWPRMMSRRFDFNTFTVQTSPNENYDKTIVEMERHFNDAISFGALGSKPANLKMEAMQGLFDGSKLLAIHASGPKEIVQGVKFAQNHGVKRIAVVAAEPAWYVRDFLKENSIPVILPNTHRTPQADSDYDLPYKLPYLLHKEGVMVSLSHSGMLGLARNLPFNAGTAAAHGLSKEEALMTITSNTAKILGIDDRVGTLETGKDATLFVSKGDALDMRTNILSHAFISGKEVTLDNKQQELYERFSKKYGHIE